MDTNNEILDAIEILADKKIGDNITKVLTGICTSVNINKNTCIMNSNGVSGTVYFYGSPPEVNGLYRIFVPSNDMSRSFIIVPPKFTVNPNLLDNWYFGNPVNQRGLTEYSSGGYTVDRWIQAFDGTMTSTLTDDGIKITAGNDGTYKNFEQVLPDIPINSTFTLSFLVDNYAFVNQIYTGLGHSKFDIEIEDNLISLTFKTGSSISGQKSFGIQAKVGKTVTILAAKLELGSQQTLAHLKNGNWVLNGIPDYGEQLRRCQRYFYRVNSHAYGWTYNNNTVNCLIPLPVTLRTSPVITLNKSGTINTVKGDASMTSYEVKNAEPNGLIIDLHNSANALTTGTPVVWHNFDIDISADL